LFISLLYFILFYLFINLILGPPALSRRIFEKYDTDESGTIDRNEFKAMCYDLGYYLSEPETDIAFRTIDLYVQRASASGP
jgi:hypothetical protein